MSDKPLTQHDYYKIYRSYREHEHNLLNNRLSWNLTIQGFLFTAYGVAQSTSGPSNRLSHLIPWGGAVMSAAVLFSVTGALISLMKLKKDWRKVPFDPQSCLPDPAAAGSMPAFWLGFVSPFVIPSTCLILWLMLRFVS